jgi:hypothetical protein
MLALRLSRVAARGGRPCRLRCRIVTRRCGSRPILARKKLKPKTKDSPVDVSVSRRRGLTDVDRGRI